MVYASEAEYEDYVRFPLLLAWRFREARPQREKVFVDFWRKRVDEDRRSLWAREQSVRTGRVGQVTRAP